MAHWQARYPGDIDDLSYEALVSEPESAIGGLLSFLQLAHEPLLERRGASGPVRTPSAWQVRQPLHARSAGRWRNYEEQLAEVRRRLGR